MSRSGLLTAGALLTLLLAGCSGAPPDNRSASPPAPAPAAAPPDAEPASRTADANATPGQAFVPVIRGTAEIAYTKPVTKVENNVVVTTFHIRNRSAGAIAGLKLEEYWWDKSGSPVTGSTTRMKTRLEPGETTTLTLETPKVAGMYQCNYRFSHANGTITAVVTNRLE